MSCIPVNLTGKRFGRLVALSRTSRGGVSYWLCRCDCGNRTMVQYANLAYGTHTRSCGCLYQETRKTANLKHGMSLSKEYKAWRSMHDRTTKPNVQNYSRYGGRGIRVCRRWRRFENFFADMGRAPSRRHSLDRRDNSGHYTPGNCRWATPRTQAQNRRPRTRYRK